MDIIEKRWGYDEEVGAVKLRDIKGAITFVANCIRRDETPIGVFSPRVLGVFGCQATSPSKSTLWLAPVSYFSLCLYSSFPLAFTDGLISNWSLYSSSILSIHFSLPLSINNTSLSLTPMLIGNFVLDSIVNCFASPQLVSCICVYDACTNFLHFTPSSFINSFLFSHTSLYSIFVCVYKILAINYVEKLKYLKHHWCDTSTKYIKRVVYKVV